MPASFTIKNTGDYNLEIKIQGGGPVQTATVAPNEEQTFTVDKNSHVRVDQGAAGVAPQPLR